MSKPSGWQEEARRYAQDAAYWQERCEKAEQEKAGIYKERDLVLALAVDALRGHSITCWLGKHPEGEEWEADWRNIVYIELPNGQQLSWHIHDSELGYFPLLPPLAIPWDGHTTEEKYKRLLAWVKADTPEGPQPIDTEDLPF